MMGNSNDLRVLICEDEYLLAADMVSELELRGIEVTGIVPTLKGLLAELDRPNFNANAVVTDVSLLDGPVFSAVQGMLDRGLAVVFCTGYVEKDIPAKFAHIPAVGKPTDIDALVAALHRQR